MLALKYNKIVKMVCMHLLRQWRLSGGSFFILLASCSGDSDCHYQVTDNFFIVPAYRMIPKRSKMNMANGIWFLLLKMRTFVLRFNMQQTINS
jgi:hypothetical protein